MATYYYYYNSSSWSTSDVAITSTSTTGYSGYSLYMRVKVVTNGNSWTATMQVGGNPGMSRELWNYYWCTIQATGGNKSWSYDDRSTANGNGHGAACTDGGALYSGTTIISPNTWSDWYGSVSGTGNITSLTWGWQNSYFNSGAVSWTSSALSLNLTNVYIYNGSSWVSAQPYIWNGSSWVLAQPYIYSGGWIT